MHPVTCDEVERMLRGALAASAEYPKPSSRDPLCSRADMALIGSNRKAIWSALGCGPSRRQRSAVAVKEHRLGQGAFS